MANEGFFGVVVWPTYVGAINILGAEPDGDYQRGQINWQTDEHGQVRGHTRILVPAGFYTHLAYYHGPTTGLMVGLQQIAHPFDFKGDDGVIDMMDITEKDFTQLPTPKGFVLPLPVTT